MAGAIVTWSRRFCRRATWSTAHDHQGFGRSGGARGWINRFYDYLSDITQIVSMARQRNPRPPLLPVWPFHGRLIGLYYLLEMPGAADLSIISSPALQTHPLSAANRFLKQLLLLLHRVRPNLAFAQRGTLDVISRDWQEVHLATIDSLGVRQS